MNYPKTRLENLKFRATILQKAKLDPVFQSAVRKAIQKNILFWINTFCYIYDGKGDIYKKLGYNKPDMLFLTWKYQDQYILDICKAIEKGEDLLTEKARDMGVSWLVITIFLWYWLFHVGSDFLIGSRKGEYVDKFGTMDALFPKIRYQLYKQPNWIMPLGFNKEIHDNYMRLINPENNNFLKGEACNKHFGSGGRYKAVFPDEFAKWGNDDEDSWRSLSDTTNCRLPVSSAFGTANYFYRLRQQKENAIKVKTLNYDLNPLKDDDWLEKQKKRRSIEDINGEILIKYASSIPNRCYPNFDQEIQCAKPHPKYNTNLKIVLECDFNIDPMSWALCHEQKGNDYYFSEIVIRENARTITTIQEFCKKYKKHKNKTIDVYGDASGKYGATVSPENNYEIIRNELEKEKWEVRIFLRKKNPRQIVRIKCLNKRLYDYSDNGKNHIFVNPIECPTIVESFEQTQRKGDVIDKKGGVEHITDGIGYKAEYKYPLKRRGVRQQ